MGNEPTDAELLDGDADAFEAFYRRHVAVVDAYVGRRAGSRELTVDIVAETFARALAARHRFDPALGPGVAWLIAIARNLLRDAARRGRVADDTRRRLRMERVEVIEGHDDAGDFDASHLAAALETLPPEQREAVLARIVDEEPYAEIADRVACSEQVIRKRVSRGLATARRALEERS